MQRDWAEGPVIFTIYSNIACPERERLGSKVLRLTWWKMFQNHARRSGRSHSFEWQVCSGLQIKYFSSWWHWHFASLPAILQWHRFQYLHTEVQQVTDQTDRCKRLGSCNRERGMSLIGMHLFTGCDTVNSFSGHGKLSALKLLIENKKIPRCFSRFGHQWTVPDDLFDILQEFASSLYSLRSTSCDVNDLRYELFRAKKGAVASEEFPLCSDCLCLHVANHQAAIWQDCLEKFPRV